MKVMFAIINVVVLIITGLVVGILPCGEERLVMA